MQDEKSEMLCPTPRFRGDRSALSLNLTPILFLSCVYNPSYAGRSFGRVGDREVVELRPVDARYGVRQGIVDKTNLDLRFHFRLRDGCHLLPRFAVL